jgi:hypothetical protein
MDLLIKPVYAQQVAPADLAPDYIYSNFNSFGQLFTSIINIGFALLGVIILFFIILGGYRYLTSGGDKAQIASARGTIYHAIIGLVILFAMFVVFTLISTAILGTGINLF